MEVKRFSTPINFVLFQACWFACVWGAANSYSWLGPALVVLTVPLQVFLLTDRSNEEILFIIICGLSGFLLETILILGGVYTPIGQKLQICPPWMAALWFNFAMLVSISLAWLKGKYLLAAVLGGLAGPVAYWGGEKLGALAIADAFARGYVPLVLLWAVALPALIYIHNRMTLQKKN